MTKLTAAVLIGGASREHARKDADFYATPPEATEALLGVWRPPAGALWDPACGDGAICREVERLGWSCVASDLRDTGYGEGGRDFLLTPRRLLPAGVTAIVTNPPFALADRFIVRCAEYPVPFALLLKATYWHAKSRATLLERTAPAEIRALTWRLNFEPGRGKSPTMDCMWVIWNARPAPHPPLYRTLSKP